MKALVVFMLFDRCNWTHAWGRNHLLTLSMLLWEKSTRNKCWGWWQRRNPTSRTPWLLLMENHMIYYYITVPCHHPRAGSSNEPSWALLCLSSAYLVSEIKIRARLGYKLDEPLTSRAQFIYYTSLNKTSQTYTTWAYTIKPSFSELSFEMLSLAHLFNEPETWAWTLLDY